MRWKHLIIVHLMVLSRAFNRKCLIVMHLRQRCQPSDTKIQCTYRSYCGFNYRHCKIPTLKLEFGSAFAGWCIKNPLRFQHFLVIIATLQNCTFPPWCFWSITHTEVLSLHTSSPFCKNIIRNSELQTGLELKFWEFFLGWNCTKENSVYMKFLPTQEAAEGESWLKNRLGSWN